MPRSPRGTRRRVRHLRDVGRRSGDGWLLHLVERVVALRQTGIFAVGTSSHAYIELDLVVGADPVAAVRVLANLAERARAASACAR